MASDKVRRLRTLLTPPPDWRDWEFTMIVFGRPISAVFVYLLEGVAFVTPNRLTGLAFACLLAGSGLLAFSRDHDVLACVLLFARMVLDDTDGMLARFRGQCSRLGSYLDKVTDAVGFFVLFAAVGVRAAEATGQGWWVLVSVSGAFSLLLMGYVKHVARGEEMRARGVPEAPQNESNAGTFPKPAEFAAKLVARLAVPMESDLLSFTVVFVLLARFDWAAAFYAVTQGVAAAVQVVRRGRAVAALDR